MKFKLTKDKECEIKTYFTEFTNKIADLLTEKHSGYKTSVSRLQDTQIIGRIGEKIVRLQNLVEGKKHIDDLDEEYQDIAGYCILAIMLHDTHPLFFNANGKPKADLISKEVILSNLIFYKDLLKEALANE